MLRKKKWQAHKLNYRMPQILLHHPDRLCFNVNHEALIPVEAETRFTLAWIQREREKLFFLRSNI